GTRQVGEADSLADAQLASALGGKQFITEEGTQAALAEVLSGGKTLDNKSDEKIIRFEVSENAKRFVFDETPLFDDGAPTYGNEFVTEGYIYPAGTLNGTNGVNPDGSPEFPNKVIGR